MPTSAATGGSVTVRGAGRLGAAPARSPERAAAGTLSPPTAAAASAMEA